MNRKEIDELEQGMEVLDAGFLLSIVSSLENVEDYLFAIALLLVAILGQLVAMWTNNVNAHVITLTGVLVLIIKKFWG